MKIEDLQNRVDELITLAGKVLATERTSTYSSRSVSSELFNEFRAASLSFLKKVFGEDHPFYKEFDKNAKQANPYYKPRVFEKTGQLTIRHQVAENYIRQNQYDWCFKVVFDDEIVFTRDELANWLEHCKSFNTFGDKNQAKMRMHMEKKDTYSMIQHVPTNREIEYVMFGVDPYFYKCRTGRKEAWQKPTSHLYSFRRSSQFDHL